MENTGKVFFEDDSPQWFLAVGEGTVGPLSASEVYDKIMKMEITWAHYVQQKGKSDWTRVCDTEAFQAVVPKKPSAPAKPSSAAVQTQPAEPKSWFLYYNDTQFGPFSESEIRRSLEIGKINPRVHAWRDGMENWDRIEKIAAFGGAAKGFVERRAEPRVEPAPQLLQPTREEVTPTPMPHSRSIMIDMRENPRRPLVAKILLSDDKTLVTGMCRDISVGGMQVLTDHIPGTVGSRIKLNVSPVGKDSQTGRTIEPFAAQGVIVRLLEDKRGFSFRFDKLSEQARSTIEKYFV